MGGDLDKASEADERMREAYQEARGSHAVPSVEVSSRLEFLADRDFPPLRNLDEINEYIARTIKARDDQRARPSRSVGPAPRRSARRI